MNRVEKQLEALHGRAGTTFLQQVQKQLRDCAKEKMALALKSWVGSWESWVRSQLKDCEAKALQKKVIFPLYVAL